MYELKTILNGQKTDASRQKLLPLGMLPIIQYLIHLRARAKVKVSL